VATSASRSPRLHGGAAGAGAHGAGPASRRWWCRSGGCPRRRREGERLAQIWCWGRIWGWRLENCWVHLNFWLVSIFIGGVEISLVEEELTHTHTGESSIFIWVHSVTFRNLICPMSISLFFHVTFDNSLLLTLNQSVPP
jgi:hypothetical protein